MDAVVAEHVVGVLRDRWELEVSRIDLARSVMLVTSDGATLVARLLPTAAVRLIHAVLAGANGLSGSVPVVVPDHSGAAFVSLSSDTSLIVTTFLVGDQPVAIDAGLAEQIGSIVAKLHQASTNVAAHGQRFGRDIAGTDWVRAITRWTCSDPAAENLRRWALTTYPQVIDDYTSLPLAIGHGDIQRENIAIGHSVGLYDFGGCYLGARALDLANAVVNLAGASGELNGQLASAVLKGYTDHVRLTDREAELLPVVAALDLVRIVAWLDTAGRGRLDADELLVRRGWRVKLARSLIAELDAVRRPDPAKTTFSGLVEAFR